MTKQRLLKPLKYFTSSTNRTNEVVIALELRVLCSEELKNQKSFAKSFAKSDFPYEGFFAACDVKLDL